MSGCRLFGRRSGLFAALILGTCTGFLVQARLDITDMTLTCTLSAALAFFIVAAREGERHPGRYYYFSYLCAALAVLAKGLIGIVFPGAIIFLYLLFTRRWRLLKEMHLLTGMLLFFAVSAPWFIMISLRNPEFARFFFIHEHFERFTSTVHGRYQPLWFFVPVLLGTMLPWSLFIPASVRGIWTGRTTRTVMPGSISSSGPLSFFSSSPSPTPNSSPTSCRSFRLWPSWRGMPCHGRLIPGSGRSGFRLTLPAALRRSSAPE